jgi:hypothetical protein
MSTLTPELTLVRPRPLRNPLAPLATLARRRFQLTARTPRELAVPLITPILFALVIAPALKAALHTGSAYESFVATGAPSASSSPRRSQGRCSCSETSSSRSRSRRSRSPS